MCVILQAFGFAASFAFHVMCKMYGIISTVRNLGDWSAYPPGSDGHYCRTL